MERNCGHEEEEEGRLSQECEKNVQLRKQRFKLIGRTTTQEKKIGEQGGPATLAGGPHCPRTKADLAFPLARLVAWV